MKRYKRILVLASVLAVICISAFAVSRYEKKQEEIKATAAIILEIPADTVQTISWERADDGLSFTRQDEGWAYDDDEDFPVSGEKMDELLANFESMGASFVIENVDDYGQYGLDDPECVITIGTGDESYSLKLGDYSKMDQQRYVDSGDGNVYLASLDPMDYLAEGLSDMIEHDSTAIFEKVERISVEGEEDYSILMLEDSGMSYSEDDIYYAQLGSESLPLNSEYVTEYLNTITSLELKNYVTYTADQEDLSVYGLEEPEVSVSIDFSYTNDDEEMVSDTYSFMIGFSPEEQAAYDEAVENEETELPEVTKYIRIGDSRIVYELDDLAYITLHNAYYDDLRHKELIWAGSEKIMALDIELENEQYSFHRDTEEEKAEDEEQKWLWNEEEIDVSSLLAKLENLSADSFTDEKPSDVEEISLTVHLDDENFPKLDIEIYRYDGENCLAAINGESVSLVDRSDVVEFIESVREIVL